MATMKRSIDKHWLVKNRSEIQERMLKLYELHDFSDTEDEVSTELWPVYGVLIGVVFSLWRAVFLIQTNRETKGEIEHGRDLLNSLIETNSVSFSTDLATLDWMAGFYVANAALRLGAIAEMPRLDDILESDTSGWLKANLSPFDLDMMTFTSEHLSNQWTKALRGYDMIFRDLDAYKGRIGKPRRS
ncbi:hypothetical protein RLW55_16770 [Hyphomicrobium sp. B1]|uniref:hypothetical protein n=1 Tax=Hyphomicrobium sp. B1 TaxID=3075651 RepID=UPI003C300FC8